ncbi:putative molybdate transport system solute-binding protein [Corynebacterium maris DSM 45190]|uniref:Putative molybdate transport system solute-binding protein n=1 Tax=Corynebacterium maris DSM 45190 TaxID=1224163 RepID=S5SU84_9CORY|nr:molybdate ABC transporter substrate-binding protein [Corynebacterium maris]AGS34602.1 putative molybdate transport system solute-binding protein [Corynebacterium maris DSM 45190]
MTRLPRPLARAATLLGAAVLLTGCTAPGTGTTGATDLQVFGASSTRVINDELSALAAELEPPHELTFNNDGSGTLVTQLHEGAPADVLITADEHSMDQAVADGSVDEPRHLATNTMVMVVPAGNPAGIDSVDDLADDRVDLVLCDPQVPCGRASERLIEHNDLTLDPVSLEGAVGDVLGKVHNGEADAGWVYRTDAAAAGDDVEVIDIPGAENAPTTLWVAAATASQTPERAAALVELILSPDVATILADAGFTPAA